MIQVVIRLPERGRQPRPRHSRFRAADGLFMLYTPWKRQAPLPLTRGTGRRGAVFQGPFDLKLLFRHERQFIPQGHRGNGEADTQRWIVARAKAPTQRFAQVIEPPLCTASVGHRQRVVRAFLDESFQYREHEARKVTLRFAGHRLLAQSLGSVRSRAVEHPVSK